MLLGRWVLLFDADRPTLTVRYPRVEPEFKASWRKFWILERVCWQTLVLLMAWDYSRMGP
jgi:hypothetical protein